MAPAKKEFEHRVAAIEALTQATPSPEVTAALRKALADKNNFLVSKAAAAVGNQGLQILTDDLLSAFARFLKDATKTDPQCWAKNAIVKALRQLGHSDAAVFIQGTAHVQMEPVWGGSTDTAAGLRGLCALALVDCILPAKQLLSQLVDLTADKEKIVRVEAVRALSATGLEEAELLLRMKALAGDREAEVTGQCFLGLLELKAPGAVVFVEKFLTADEELQFEAISALGVAPQAEAVDALIRYWKATQETGVIRALGLSKHPAAVDYLVDLCESGPSMAASIAIEALAKGRFREEVRVRTGGALARRDDGSLLKVFDRFFKT